MSEFSVFVSKADFKFNCAHFISFKGFRERLHGHNYALSVKVTGADSIGPDGYVIDFGDVKKATRQFCKELNEYFICPMNSDTMTISEVDGQICLECEDGAKFSFPKSDCALLPLIHSSAEELSHYFWCKIVRSAIEGLNFYKFIKF
jgi:6-pyruvoyltetrahydropterin/6-carboxytetrahydropterin synthase